jgi:tryptophan synthase alpha chain
VRLIDALSNRRAAGRCGFVPFVTAGDPSLSATKSYLAALEKAGADIIEVGVPFSDPVADGPVIQAADMRALKKGASLLKVLAMIRSARASGFETPVVLFTYLNPAMNLGLSRFAKLCKASGVEGVLAVDAPVEESGPLSDALKKEGVELVLLASPTTSDERLRLIGRGSGSIVYYVSREGVTGVRSGLAPNLAARLKKVRALTGKPLIVGFGVARRAQAKALAPHAAGVVAGSALVEAAFKNGERGLLRVAREIIKGLGK